MTQHNLLALTSSPNTNMLANISNKLGTTMYGLLLENMSEFIKQVYGEDKWEEIRRMAQVDQPSFSVHQVYPENLIPRLAKKAIQSRIPCIPNTLQFFDLIFCTVDTNNIAPDLHHLKERTELTPFYWEVSALITDIPRTSSRNTAHCPSSTRKQELSHRVACDPCALVRYPPSSRRCAGAKLGEKSEKCYHVCLLTPSWLTSRRCAQAPSLGKEREVLSRVSSYPLMVNLTTLCAGVGERAISDLL
uniref:Heme NO-binding domain-containing protein n=1 Tax=Timema monikensis TaxID=170555 RepID=A0A7R9HPY5_9NEOP|nr:unnamed protein product [Timema monikensis]